MEGGKTANYWPGFVDALTNVVIAMVFVIVVLAIALSFAAQMMGKKMAEELSQAKAAVAIAKAAAHSVSSQGPSAEETPSPSTDARTVIEVKARMPAAAASSSLRVVDRGLRLVFADNALVLDKDAVDQLRAALAPRKAEAANTRVEVVATGPSMALSENQRTAYLRVLAVRNELIDQGYPPDHITVRIDTSGTSARATVGVSFQANGATTSATTGLADSSASRAAPIALTAPTAGARVTDIADANTSSKPTATP